MTTFRPTQSARPGFSLVEVTLAIGIVGVAILSLVGILGSTFQQVDDVLQTNRALTAATEEQKAAAAALFEGVQLTLRELTNVMTRHGVKPITPKVGDMFDPQNHEAMFEAPVPGTKAGQIIQVMTEGFMLHDRLLRPAQVGVSATTGA